MARTFTVDSTDQLEVTGGRAIIATASALTISVWAKLTDHADTGVRTISSNWSQTPESGMILFRVSGATDDVQGYIYTSGGQFGGQFGSLTMTGSGWHHMVYQWDGSATLTGYKDGSSGVASSSITGTFGTQTDHADFYIGDDDRDTDSSASSWAGDQAEFAIWRRSLTAGEIAGLAGGFSPLFYRDELTAYWPCGGPYGKSTGDERDIVGGYTATEVGTIEAADHPPIIYPSTPQTHHVAAAAPAAGPNMLTLLGVG